MTDCTTRCRPRPRPLCSSTSPTWTPTPTSRCRSQRWSRSVPVLPGHPPLPAGAGARDGAGQCQSYLDTHPYQQVQEPEMEQVSAGPTWTPTPTSRCRSQRWSRSVPVLPGHPPLPAGAGARFGAGQYKVVSSDETDIALHFHRFMSKSFSSLPCFGLMAPRRLTSTFRSLPKHANVLSTSEGAFSRCVCGSHIAGKTGQRHCAP